MFFGHQFPDIFAHNLTVETLYRYPRGAAGFARLLLRSALGLLVLANGCSEIFTISPGTVPLLRIVTCFALCLGLFTSYLGIIVAILSLGAMIWGHVDISLVQIATLILGVAIAILGPGGHSVDALLFGRRRVIL